ncbi:MAG: glycosyltransferase family A protein, partial [Armatimonadota bacterium]
MAGATLHGKLALRLAIHRFQAAFHRTRCAPRPDSPKVEVVVCSLNTLDPLRLTLATLRKHTRYPRFELRVIDNASSDGSAEYLRARAELGELRLVEAERRYHSDWVEERFRSSDASIVVFVDSDMIFFESDWLDDIVGAFEADPEVGVVSGEPKPFTAGVV